MPYSDPDKQRAAMRESYKRRYKADYLFRKEEQERKRRYKDELAGESDPKQLYVTIIPTPKGKQLALRGNPKLIKKAIQAVLEIQEANSRAAPASAPKTAKAARPRARSSRTRKTGDRK